jgi:hypothetical protein
MPTQKWTCEQCGTSFDRFQDASDCERSHKSRSKGYRASTSGRLAKTGVPEDRSVYLIHEPGQEALRWGCHINISDSYDTKRYPEWVKSLPFSSSWGNRGLVVWDESIKTVAHIRSVDAFELLIDLQTNAIGAVTVVGERRMKLSGNQVGQEPAYTLVNQISLNTAQANELLRFLQENEAVLQKMAKEAEERWDQALRTAYRIMIQAYLRRQAEECANSQS